MIDNWVSVGFAIILAFYGTYLVFLSVGVLVIRLLFLSPKLAHRVQLRIAMMVWLPTLLFLLFWCYRFRTVDFTVIKLALLPSFLVYTIIQLYTLLAHPRP